MCNVRVPTDFLLQLRCYNNKAHDVPKVRQMCWSTAFEALKMWEGRSGHYACISQLWHYSLAQLSSLLARTSRRIKNKMFFCKTLMRRDFLKAILIFQNEMYFDIYVGRKKNPDFIAVFFVFFRRSGMYFQTVLCAILSPEDNNPLGCPHTFFCFCSELMRRDGDILNR